MKVPCGGFDLDESVFNVDKNAKQIKLNSPISYDYMPEGYPKKVEFTGVLMEEQSVPNGKLMPNPLLLIEGNTYTVTFDGTNYECVCRKYEYINEGETEPETILFYIGGSETGTPFMYQYVVEPSEGVAYGFWDFADEQESHTISVQGTGLKAQTISPVFLPTGDASPYEPRVANTKKVYVAEYRFGGKNEDLYNEVKTAYKNGYYVLLYYYRYNAGNNPIIFTLSQYFEGTFWFVHFEGDDGEFWVIELNPSSSSEETVGYNNYTPYYLNDTTNAPDHLYLKAYGTNKLFEIRVDGSGNLSATEVTT